MGSRNFYGKLLVAFLAVSVLFILGKCDRITSPQAAKVTMTEIDFPPPAKPGTQAFRRNAQKLPDNYCYVSTLNAVDAEKAYTYRAYKITLPKGLQKKAENIGRYRWITLKMGSRNAEDRLEADPWEGLGIVRIAHCWIPDIKGILPQLKKQFKKFDTSSWVVNNKSKESNDAANVAKNVECQEYWTQTTCYYTVVTDPERGTETWYLDYCETDILGCSSWGSGGGDSEGGGPTNDDSDMCSTYNTGLNSVSAYIMEQPPEGCKDPNEVEPCTTSNTRLKSTFNDPAIKAAIGDLWIYSNTHLPITQRVEQGGWITQNSNGELGFITFPDSWNNTACSIIPPAGWKNSIPANTIGWVHTHPFWKGDNTKLVCGADGSESYSGCGASQDDFWFSAAMMDHLDKIIAGYTISGSNITTINANYSTNCYGRCSY